MKHPPTPFQQSELTSSIGPLRTDALPATFRRRDLIATLISTAFHLVALLLISFWVLPSFVGPKNIVVYTSWGEPESVVVDATKMDIVEAPLRNETPERPVELPEPVVVVPDIRLQMEPVSDAARLADRATDSVDIDLAAEPPVSSDSVEGAVDSVTGAIEAKLKSNNVLVIWLLDSSASLVDDRQRVAARLTPFYERVAARLGDSKHELQSAVVSYGASMKERVAPTGFGERIVSAVDQLPVDRSGDERVFDAVARCADHYRKDWPKHQLMIVVWTDESGDDVFALESTIATCLGNQAIVSVVGPSSVLGANTGLHSYVDPKSQATYQIPVTRGPESAMPERIQLGYWYLTQIGGRRRGYDGGLPAWIGGQDLYGILCGFSPYALTRLTAKTGGTYTIFDRPEDRSPFDFVTMARYAPSFRSLDDYQSSIRDNPLRQAVMNAARELDGKNVDAPPTMLFTKKTGERVFDFMRLYYPPNEFQTKLRSSRVRMTRQASRYAALIEQSLSHLSDGDSPENGLDELFESETSPRWRAWHDLTRGRLLATSVRLEEYRLVLQEITKPGFLAPTTNFVLLTDSQEKRSDGKFVARAAEAERLLRRCVDEHRGTPWEVLAQRELDFALGIEVRERSLTPTPGAPAAKQPTLPKF